MKRSISLRFITSEDDDSKDDASEVAGDGELQKSTQTKPHERQQSPATSNERSLAPPSHYSSPTPPPSDDPTINEATHEARRKLKQAWQRNSVIYNKRHIAQPLPLVPKGYIVKVRLSRKKKAAKGEYPTTYYRVLLKNVYRLYRLQS